jgi:hypothetical protein
MQHMKATGKFTGGFPPYGYSLDEDATCSRTSQSRRRSEREGAVTMSALRRASRNRDGARHQQPHRQTVRGEPDLEDAVMQIVRLSNGGHYRVWVDHIDEWKVGCNFESAGYMTSDEAVHAGTVIQRAATRAATLNRENKSDR